MTSAHSKSSNSSGFNPILKKFYKMICKIIVSKTVGRIFLIFCRSISINNSMLKNSFSEPNNQRKLNISRPICFKKNVRTPFCRSYLYKLAGRIFFPKNFFFNDLKLFSRLQHDQFGRLFFRQKNNFTLFSRVII